MRAWRSLPLLLALSCAPAAPAQHGDARAGGGFVVRQGREIKIKGEDLRIGLVSVAEDSRCPEGATCVWAGNARARMIARDSGGARAEFDLNTNLAPTEYEFGRYRISLARLTPAPSIHGLPKPGEYAATVIVAKVGKK